EKAEAAQWATLLWSNIQYRSEAQLADALLKKRQTGYPLQWIAEQDGLDPAEVDRLMEMVEQEQADPLGERLLREVADAAAAGRGAPASADAPADRWDAGRCAWRVAAVGPACAGRARAAVSGSCGAGGGGRSAGGCGVVCGVCA